MMKKALFHTAPLAIGICTLMAGWLYDVLYAGIPYPDPTPEQQAQYNFHSTIAFHILGAGVILVTVGSLWFIVYLFTFAKRRRDSRS